METINIAATSADWRGVALSNFCLSPFLLDDVLIASVEGFIQGIKFPEGHALRDAAFAAHGAAAKALAIHADRASAYWGGHILDYASPAHHRLIERAIHARILQNRGLQATLLSTGTLRIIHETGVPEARHTSLPAHIFVDIMTRIRHELSAR